MKFSCLSFSRAKWTFNNGDLPNNVKLNKEFNTILLSKVDLSNSGSYACYVEETQDIILEGNGVLLVSGKLY